LDFPWLGKCGVLFLPDLYIYFGFPLARLKWRILLKSVRLPLHFARVDLATSWQSSCIVMLHFEGGVSKGTSIHFPTSPLLSYSPSVPSLTSVPSPGITPKANNIYTRWSDNFLDVDSLKVVNFCPPSLPALEWHQMSCGHIGTGPHDTTVPSTITWTPIYGRLSTRRLGTVTLCISFVD
jgi:hypothetical protein